MTAPVTDPKTSPSPVGGPSDKWPWNALVVTVGVIALLILAKMALSNLVTSNTKTDGKLGASDAISLITASGAILTGIIGAYFGVNLASKTTNAAQETQKQASADHQTTLAQMNDAHKTAVAAAITADPQSPIAQQVAKSIMESG